MATISMPPFSMSALCCAANEKINLLDFFLLTQGHELLVPVCNPIDTSLNTFTI